MSRRLTPYLLAGLLGVISGAYIFKPLFEKTAATREIRGTTGAVDSTERPQSQLETDTVNPRHGK